MPCQGLSVTGDRFYRLLPTRTNEGSELIEYDRRGVLRYTRIDGIGEPHDILPDADGSLLIVNTNQTKLTRVSRSGDLSTVWEAGLVGDCWHLNCLARHEGSLFATAFGRFDRHRGWSGGERGWKGAGLLVELATGKEVLQGLSQPHSPMRLDASWLVCDSAAHALLRAHDDGRKERIPIDGYPRGLCVHESSIYVGVSRDRTEHLNFGYGCIIELDRSSLIEVRRLPAPVGGIYSIVAVDDELFAGIESGFRFGSHRERFFGQLAMFESVGIEPSRLWAIAEPLDARDCRVDFEATLPSELGLNDISRVSCSIRNVGGAFLIPAPPNPVEICYRWFDGDGNAVGAGTWLHTQLPRIVPPGGTIVVEAMIAPPPEPGEFTLRLTLLQEGVWWFDDLDEKNGVTGRVRISEHLPARK